MASDYLPDFIQRAGVVRVDSLEFFNQVAIDSHHLGVNILRDEQILIALNTFFNKPIVYARYKRLRTFIRFK